MKGLGLLVVSWALFLATLSGIPVNAQNPPVLFYSDIDSGPAAGGENGDGAFVCVYGENFGAARGASKLEVGGVEVAAYKVWTDSPPYLPGHYAKACGQLSHATPSGAVPVLLKTNAGVSNPLPFTMRSGKIYFASAAGSDIYTGADAGSSAHPFATLKKCKNQLAPGDICYLHAMTVTAKDAYGYLWLGTSGAEGNPKTVAAYPGEHVAVDGTKLGGTGLVNYAAGNYVSYWTIAGLTFDTSGVAVDLTPGSNFRIVDNDIMCTGPQCEALAAGFVGYGTASQALENISIYGNRFHDIGCHDYNDSASYLNYESSPNPCPWLPSGTIVGYSSGKTFFISGYPSSWTAPDVIEIKNPANGQWQVRRPVKAGSGYCSEILNGFDCAGRAAVTMNGRTYPAGYAITLDQPFSPDIPATTPVSFQFRLYAPAKTEHNVYFGSYVYYLDFGWNEIDGSAGQACRGFQSYHDGVPNAHHLLIHDNYIHDTVCDGINLANADPTWGPVEIYNNLLINNGKGVSDVIADLPGGGGNNAGIYLSGAGANTALGGKACQGNSGICYPDQVVVYNNTIVNSGIVGAKAVMQWPKARGGITRAYDFWDPKVQLIISNNILVQPAGSVSPYYSAYQPSSANTLASGNLCFGIGACPANFSMSAQGNPGFINPLLGNYHLADSSPAVNTGPAIPRADNDLDGSPATAYYAGAYDPQPPLPSPAIPAVNPANSPRPARPSRD